jgi:hypothetical protein
MSHNAFKFGDTFWVQLQGMVMGTPPAPMYATLYFFIREQQIIPLFDEIKEYGRYIDDGLVLWTPRKGTSAQENAR